VQFDRFLAPDSAVRQAICVQAGDPNDKSIPCVGNLSPEYDPVDRVAVWKNSGSLLANQRYNVRLLVPANADDPTGVRAFDGVPLETEFRFAFTTGSGPNPMFVEPDRTTKSGFCATSSAPEIVQGPQDYLTGLGACTGCHIPNYPTRPSPSAFVLKEPPRTIADIVQSLVMEATVATESATGPDPVVARRSPKDVFGENMPYLDAKNPGNSFLLYKVLLAMLPRCGHQNEESANPPYADQACPQQTFPATGASDGGAPGSVVPPIVPSWVPAGEWNPPAIGEYDRLRLRIRGDAMPLRLSAAYQNVLGLSAWIAAGASTTCP
jgi:hypothetical protein